MAWMSRVCLKWAAIRDWRRCGRRVMANMGEWRLTMGVAVELGRHHLVLWVLRAFVSSGRCAIAFIVVVVVISSVEISWTFVFVRTTVLQKTGSAKLVWKQWYWRMCDSSPNLQIDIC